jgi:peptidoglycan/xylan/chitin deacetylase (PgdA/CDA1 family)
MISAKAMNRRVPVIMYHDVVAREGGPGWVFFNATTQQFAEQMAWIASHGYTPITLDALYAHLTTGAEIPEKSIVLTFDDNYRGFYDNAFPILKQYNYPSAMFVHTNFVGNERGFHPKMTWDQLKELQASGLVTIGAHTRSHPPDMTLLSDDQQEDEIAGSKKVLEDHLRGPIDYLAYPDGKNNATSQAIAKKSGFKMAMAMNSGLAEESPNLYCIHRWEHLKLEKAVEDAETVAENAPAGYVEQAWTTSPVKLTVGEFDGLKVGIVTGGSPETYLSDHREGVEDIVSQSGGAAGINGGFFAMAAINSESNVMIGPAITQNKGEFTVETSPRVLSKLRERPIVLWDGSRVAICNFQPESLDAEEPYRQIMPDFKNLFLAGAWMVHNGLARTDEVMLKYASKDLADPRRRAFFGWNAQGQPMIGASLQTCSTGRLAEAAAAAGAQEAVLLDSGFSTSLVFDGRIIVTGHTSEGIPSRPVPHAIILKGDLDLDGAEEMMKSAAEGAKAPQDVEGEKRVRRRRTHRKVEDVTPDLTPDVVAPDPSTDTDKPKKRRRHRTPKKDQLPAGLPGVSPPSPL